MAETTVRMEGAQEVIIDRLTKSGFYKTRSEVMRAGVLELAAKHKIFRNAQEIEDELASRKMDRLWEEHKLGKRKAYTLEQVKKKYGYK